jgi:hypothetical protein
MISARKFCQEPGYPVTIFLTYSFDPLFFERIALDDLSMGGTRRILILADAGEIAESQPWSNVEPSRPRSDRWQIWSPSMP